MIRTSRSIPRLLCVLMVLVPALPAMAQDVGTRPVYSMRTIDGRTANTQMLLGKVVVLEFWATWCGPCVASVPHLKEINSKYASKGVVLISISRDQSESKVKEFIQAHEMTWPQVLDAKQDKSLASMFKISGIPDAVIIAPTGEVLWRGHPMSMEKHIEEALQKYPVTQDRSAYIEQAKLALTDACDVIDRQVNFTKALQMLAEISDKALNEKEIVPLLQMFVQRFNVQDEARTKLIDEALAANPEAAKRLEKLRAAHATRDVAALAAEQATRRDAQQQQRLAQLEQRAMTRLKNADRMREKGDHLGAYRQYLWIVNKAGDTQAALHADEHIAEYEKDDALMQAFQLDEMERELRSILSLAKSYIEAGQPRHAQELLEQIVKDYPDSQCAGEARTTLAKLPKAG